MIKKGHSFHLLRSLSTRILLWEIRHPTPILLICFIVVSLFIWQGSKLNKRLRGGLVSLPGSESDYVVKTVENEFSKAIAYPTILVQEGLGEEQELERNWQNALHSVKELPDVVDVIDMHLGRKIVGQIMVNTSSFHEAQQTMFRLHEIDLPKGFEIRQDLTKVSRDAKIFTAVETEVRSFKEGEMRRKEMEETMSKLDLPEGTTLKLEVTRHPRRNFAMVEGKVRSYQEAELLTANLQEKLHALNLPTGNRVKVTGLPALMYDLNREASAALNKAEWIGLPICFLLLIWVFGSPVAAFLPIVVALVALSMGTAVMSKVGKYIEISMFVPSVLSMIGLGVGVDYMLILVSRFRECMAKHTQVDEAIMEAMHLAMPTLIGSGFTVAIGFSALVFTPVMLFKAMGIAGIVVILSALLCIFILAPPLFKITCPFIRWNKPVEARTPFWRKWTHFVVEYPMLCLVAGLGAMLTIASPALGLKMGSINPDALPAKLESRSGYNLCKNGFGAGWLMPALVMIKKSDHISEEQYLEKEKNFLRKLRTRPTTFDAIGGSDLQAAASEGFSIEIPRNFLISKSGQYHLVLAMYDGNPLSVEGREWIEELRQTCRAEWRGNGEFECNVGGVVASTLDIDAAVVKYMIRTAIFCLTTTFFCLVYLYRSLLIPLQAIFMNLLSVSGAYGFLVLWFQKGVGAFLLPSVAGGNFGMNSIIILLLFCALFGLSMDYQVFLISRISEEWHRSHNNKLAVRHGIELTGRVVTGAAAVMVSIFLSFAFVSVLETRQFGTGMAAAIIFDATIIRLLVFPSLMLLIGKANWWAPFQKQIKGEH
jgi:putative drug exporter of the RND superfamily